MQPLKLIVPGSYWDSQIYSGRLYLFERDGSIRTLNWDRVLSTIPIERPLRLSLVAGFLRSDFLYGTELFALFQDPDVRGIVERKFSRLGEHPIELKPGAVDQHTIARRPNPFPFPHSDTEVYDNRLYVAGPSGLWRARCGPRVKLSVSTRVERLFDSPILGIAGSYGTIAAAAGSEGLFEFPVDGIGTEDQRATTELACDDCNWTYHSIYASSAHGGFLVDYERHNRNRSADSELPEWRRHYPPIERTLNGIINGEDIFQRTGFTWGVHDKICSASNGTIDVARYAPWNEERSERLSRLGAVTALRRSTDAVSASAAPFGSVVEYSDCLVIYESDGLSIEVSGEPVNWRVFPRSKHYENHLHVIYDDRLEVWSFNHDYLVQQQEKIMGTTVRPDDTKRAMALRDLMAE